VTARRDVSLLLADVDGTLATQDRMPTEASVAAARDLHDADVGIAVISRPPARG
jgi:hypothetical protein